MKKYILPFLILTLAIMAFTISRANETKVLDDQIVLAFITVSGYSNNLYIDNLTIGQQFETDVMVNGLVNIKADTSYAIGGDPFNIMPDVTITNAGKTDISSPFDVIMQVMPNGFTSTKTINSLSKGTSLSLIFDNLTITPGNENNISVYTTLATDDNRSNDTLKQYSMILPGVQRNVLLEEWTSSTCGPCAQNNPTIDAFVHSNFDSIVAIKYHVGWPSPGNDPMYLYNTTQSYDRRYYYGVNAAPTVIMDGVTYPSYPYSTASSLPNAFSERIVVGSPISVSVTDTPIASDSIQSNISVTVHAPLVSGDYYLRVHAIERTITYSSAPGTNGETVFHDVFRKAYPNSDGVPIPTALGTHDFVYKYKIDTNVWVDSMIYTTAFVQNDLTKEIMNCDRGRDQMLSLKNEMSVNHSKASESKSICIAEEMIEGLPTNLSGFYNGMAANSIGVFNLEIFETSFPPADWRVSNPDGGITFEQYSGANGNSFGGSKSVKMDFYSYSTIGASDTMYTKVYTGLSSNDSIKFEWAHAEYPGYGPDRLIVNLSMDGGATFPITIFDKSGTDLATAPNTSGTFVPNSSQWATFEYPLSSVVSAGEPANRIYHFNLERNYPNPFNPKTTIPFEIGGFQSVAAKVTIYNIIGQQVAVPLNQVLSPGIYETIWDGRDNSGRPASSGLYFYELSAGDFQMLGKLILLK